MYFFEVADVVALQTQVALAQLHGTVHQSFCSDLDEVTLTSVTRALDETLAAAGDDVRHRFQDVAPKPDFIRLPTPFAVLCLKGHWDSFCVCEMGGRQGARGGWHVGRFHTLGGQRVPRFGEAAAAPAPAEAQGQAGGAGHNGNAQAQAALAPAPRAFASPQWSADAEQAAQVAEFNFYEPEVGDAFCNEVQVAAARLHELDPQRSLADLFLYMSAFVGFVDELRGFLATQAAGKTRSRAYNVTYLVRCFFLCDALSNAGDLKEVLYNAARVLLPLKAATVLQKSLDSRQAPIPSASTISRLRGRVDIAWAMIWRRRVGEWLQQPVGPVVYPATDASPQGGRDYQILVLDIIGGSDLAELHRDAVRLERRCSELTEHDINCQALRLVGFSFAF
jgi:hypothetical protein